MKLRAIEEGDLDAAHALLVRGFPLRSPKFWREGLARLSAYRRRHRTGPVGHLLSHNGRDVGILLTIESRLRARCGSSIPRINLSSWYVEEEARWLATRMLHRLTEAGDIAYTDLTPTSAAGAINERLGFSLQSDGALLVPLPLAAPLPAGGTRVRSGFEDAGGLDDTDRLLLADHEALGALPAVLEHNDGEEPLLFLQTRVRGVPTARVLYARKPGLLMRHLGSVARHLLRRGFGFLELEAAEAGGTRFGLRSRKRCIAYLKSPLAPAGIDHSYSELVFLNL